jgi:hypothetical protein
LGWIEYAILAWGLVAWVYPVPITLLHELGHAVPARYPRWFGPYAGRISDGYRIVRLFRSS